MSKKRKRENKVERRAEASARAGRLQAALGDGYRVEFDAVDSGMTFIYYGSELIKSVPNSAMLDTISVEEYTFGWYMAHRH